MLKFSKKKKKSQRTGLCEGKWRNFLFIQIKSLKTNELFARHTRAAAAPVPNIPPGYHYGYISTYSLIDSQTIQRTGVGTHQLFSDRRKSQRTGWHRLLWNPPVLWWVTNNPSRWFFECHGFIRKRTGGSFKIQRTAQRWYVYKGRKREKSDLKVPCSHGVFRGDT
jgi:hypothetical protein